MARIALVVAVLAAALAGWGLLSSKDRCDARVDRSDLAAMEARLGSLERVLGEKPADAPPPLAGAGPAAGNASSPGSSLATAPAAAGRSSATLPDLERRLESLEKVAKEREAAEKAAAAAPQAGEVVAALPTMPSNFYGSLDDAAKDLELTPGQKADFERVLADLGRETDALRSIPAEDGKTWKDVEKDAFKMENGVFQMSFDAVTKFREKNVPGRSESFGAADRRLREDAKRRMEAGLTADQRRKFDAANKDALLGGSGGGPFGAITFSTSFDAAPAPPAPPGMD